MGLDFCHFPLGIRIFLIFFFDIILYLPGRLVHVCILCFLPPLQQWAVASCEVAVKSCLPWCFRIFDFAMFSSFGDKKGNVEGPTVVYPRSLRNCVGDDSKYPGEGDYHEGSTAEVAVCVRLTNSTKAPNTNLQNLFWSHNILSMWVTMSWRQAVGKGTADRTPSFICRITIGSVSTS